MSDVAEFVKTNPDVNYRYLVMPTKQIMPDYELLYPTPGIEQAAIDQGKQDAEDSVKAGPGTKFRELFDSYWNNN